MYNLLFRVWRASPVARIPTSSHSVLGLPAKMTKYNDVKIALSLMAIIALATAMPADHVDKVLTSGQPDNPPSFDLPFLQFKNGGIRVNFAGYHAEAGLGGLLGGSDAKGGLYASAGTPWGPSASAGLGGSLGGQDGTARGGLHARAGWGNAGPEAAAGLGGSLDGSGRSGSRARGRIYAGATAGGPQAAAGLRGSLDESGRTGSSYAAATDGQKTKITVKDMSNIQSIGPPATGDKVYLSKSGSEEPSTTLEFKLPAGTGKKAVSSSLVARDLENVNSKYGPNGIGDASDVQDNDDVLYPRRYYRKRFRGSPARKQFYKLFTVDSGAKDDGVVAASTSLNHPSGIVERQINENRPSIDTTYSAQPKSTTLFDDIFNIPISTLAAVNQLLNNKSG